MRKKTLATIIAIVLILTGALSAVVYSVNLPVQQYTQQELSFAVSGTNDCLRFLDREVQTVCIPFRAGANEQWRLTIDCSKMPGSGAGAWTDLYVYNGYWDKGNDHKCVSEQLYPIIDEIETADFRIQANNTFSGVFGASTPQSYTFFIIFPTGGSSTFNVRLEKVNTQTLELVPIRIQSDGSINPSNVPIQRNGDFYTFMGDICGTLVVDKANIVIDGAGHVLQGTFNGTRTDSWVVGQGPDQKMDNETLWTMGIDFGVENRPCNLTVRNLNIRNFYIGMYVWTSNNTIACNSVTDNIVGVLLSGDYNNITDNYIARNGQGVFFGVNTPGKQPLKIVLAGNSLLDNDVQFSGCYCEGYNSEELIHTWDDGKKGNYWSDYNGTDSNGDGLGDTPYVVDILNQDRYPLMQISAIPPTAKTALRTPFEVIILVFASAAIAVVAVIAYRKREKKEDQILKKTLP